jgi:hypothetical protein
MLLFDYKDIFWAIAIILSFITYYLYFKKIFTGVCKPHIYTAFIWFLLMSIGFLLQLSNNWWFSSWMLWISAACMFWVFVVSFRYGTKDITKFDTVVLFLALWAIPVYIYEENKLYALLLIVSIDILWSIPTIRKTFFSPHSESASALKVSLTKNFISISALQSINAFTVLYPLAIIFIEITILLTMIIRRKRVTI